MVELDNLGQIKALDTSNLLGSIVGLPDQIEQAWQEVQKIEVPEDYCRVKNIVVAGMGGSALGADFLRSVFPLDLPLETVREYKLGHAVNHNSLVILSSYSGDTEETLACAQEASNAGSKVIGISTGGKLIDFLQQKGLPYYQFVPNFNPCGQPRAGLGYSIAALGAFLQKCKIINLDDDRIKEIASHLRVLTGDLGVEKPLSENKAKKIASFLKERVVVIVGAEFLSGNAHIFANQLNETAKTLAFYFILPELNHHLMEGLENPKNLKDNLTFIFLKSSVYKDRIKKRMEITQEIISEKRITYFDYEPTGLTEVLQAFEALAFSSYVSFYLGIVNGIDPTPTPWIKLFKEKLSESV
ncbi:MAG: hypothetical protein A2Y57_01460 [Candidatus Woykebacteria bacterium RBG_13_40_7b]|uniref:SIS domain-containing protein n=1 Tax=Candidatus Woykebacteria bacterium RBG_13_40_7b TaxID=1802594 RepID=A0A1G1W674_9BACT|nr:MAG: hypothetical protein A2Y57_01460 [Candidatus Woykebacteria bacterium RBG_13_40_7b]